METHTLRRSQSLRSVSVHEGSWVMPVTILQTRKSVSQLVQQYQSLGDIRFSENEEQKPQGPVVNGQWRQWDSRGNYHDDLGPVRSFPLSRSRSMDRLPPRDPAGTGASALRALFESKAPPQHDSSSSMRLNGTPGKDCAPVVWREHSMGKAAGNQRIAKGVKQTTVIGLPAAGHPCDVRKTRPLTDGDDAAKQGRRIGLSSTSVKDRSALYLSRAAAAGSTGNSAQPEFIGLSGQRKKASKMANVGKQITVSDTPHEDDDLPPPPPPPVLTQPLDNEGASPLSGLPVPPPKETFSTFYQQRQKSELKRLFKHIHPDLRENLNDAVDDELVEAMQSETMHASDAYQAEVQSMRWIFENWTLDNIGDPHATKKLMDEEELKGGNVRGTSSMFEHIETHPQRALARHQTSIRGDVRTSTWLFETQPLDALNKLKTDEGELVEAVLKEPVQGGDVRGARLLFESKPLGDFGRCNSIEDYNFLKLKSELQEQKGDVQKTVKLFQTEPCCAIRDNSGNMHEIKSICREEIKSGSTSTARWLFETQPFDIINKSSDEVKIIRGISLEEGQRGGVDRKRWMFETQPLNLIQEGMEQVDRFEGTAGECSGEADVENTRKLFEAQPLATLTGDSKEGGLEKEEVLGGDVKTSLWLFETQPIETLSDSYEVGCLQKITLSEGEHGAVKGKKQIFENYSTNKGISVREREIEKGDVKSFKHLFETIPLSNIAHADDMDDLREKSITGGNVKGNKALFETTPLYAIKDCSGNLHEVTTVSREEFIKGNVQNYKWQFETKPFDQFADGSGNVEVIKGITREEDSAGDVKMAKWLFETQTIDGIHSKFNQKEVNHSAAAEDPQKGDVKTCRWLFETQPTDILYKSETLNDKDTIKSSNVKSFTWLFESQPLDSIKDVEEQNLKLCTMKDSFKSEVGVKTVKRLFETETLDSIRKETNSEQDARYVSQVDVQSGDVSRVKELFESQSLDEIGSEMATALNGQDKDEHIQKGSVHKVTWMFENRPINKINDKDDNDTVTSRIDGVEGGDVNNKKFIFETFSLDKIHDQPLAETSDCAEKPVSKVDVKSSTMMFESQPLYAIRDKEGQFHEVTTVKKEELMTGNVRGARWMFETKPLDAIKADNEVYVIRAVTQEDIKKGDVESARWKFETQPLDSFASHDEPFVRVVDEMGSSYVQLNKQIFESDQSTNKKYVRMVSVTDVQQGDVRTSTWLFENQPIDSLKGEPQDQSIVNTVLREDNQKGDVKRSTWLFESRPLDQIKEADDTTVHNVEEDRPKTDVKSTTWLFETTPLDKITVNSVAETLSCLHQMAHVHSSGIIIEANGIKNVTMAKYQLASEEGIQIQNEEVIEGNIRNIMLQLLCKPSLQPQITLLREMARGEVNTTVVELPANRPLSGIELDRNQRIQNIVQVIDGLLVQTKPLKKGIIMQETTGGQAEMTVYSLIHNCENRIESQDVERGDIKSAIGNLLATASHQRTESFCRIDEKEKGNVNLYKSCIEKGDLEYLKSLQTESVEDDESQCLSAKDEIEIVQGDVKEAKRSLYKQKDQVERTISDVLPGDVKNAKKVFSSEGSCDVDNSVPREEIIPGNISSAKQQLAVKQPMFVEKEEVVSGDIKATLQSLERAKQQSMYVEREVITPGTIYDMDLSAQGPEMEGNQSQKEEIISGDIKAAKKSLEMAKNQSLRMEREVIAPGKIYNVNVSAEEQCSSTETQTTSSSSSRGQQIRTTYKKVSDAVKDEKSHATFQSCQVDEMSQSAVRLTCCAPDALPPFVKSECDVHTSEDETETEVVRGDVKAAIRSLQSAATEQRLPDKEDVVRGNMRLALQSLEKSSVNVSKGDFKAAMIYRNSGRACSGSKSFQKQSVVVSMPLSDNELSPSISVTYEEAPPFTTQNTTPDPVAILSGNPTPPSSEGVTTQPPENTCEKPKDQRPALPPKPQWTKSKDVNGQSMRPAPKVPCHTKNSEQNPVVSENINQSNQSPVLSSQTLQENAKDSTRMPNKGTLDEKCHHKLTHETIQSSGCISATSETPAKCLKTEEMNAKTSAAIHKDEISESHVERKSPCSPTTGHSSEMDKNVIHKINAAEEIRMCMESYAEDGRKDLNVGFQVALETFGRREKHTADTAPVLSKKVKVVNDNSSQEKEHEKATRLKEKSRANALNQQHCDHQSQKGAAHIRADTCPIQQTVCLGEQQKPADKVVLRKKRAKETEEERIQRLSVHKEEIMKGNVKAAMEIFDNLRRREELKTILSQVQEMEGETSEVDVGSLKTLFENVPTWMAVPSRTAKQSSKREGSRVEMETRDDDIESTSSVETAFEDLEKASKEIIKLKEQTLAKLIDIEEAIKKALYSVSNLKSESDIAGLSGLFDESLKSEQSGQISNNIRKISIVSSKAKPDQNKETGEAIPKGTSGRSEGAVTTVHKKPLVRQSSAPSSPSFISIHSAARKQREQPQPPMSTFKSQTEGSSSNGANGDLGHVPAAAESPGNFHSPTSPRRKVSVLEVKAIPEAPTGIIGTKTVSETYEETDSFGNSFMSSKTSTFVTKQSDSKSSPLFEVVGSPTRYEVMTSPLMRRSGRPFAQNVPKNAKDEETVTVTFSQPMMDKH